MKANQKFLHDNKAQVGIGTMIVFIATVLVAAVAAGVLINVSGDLQSQSLATGNAATAQTASFIEITALWGQDITQHNDGVATASNYDDYATAPPADDDEIDELHIFLELAAGAKAMDMSEALVYLDTGSAFNTYKHFTKGGASPTIDDPAADGNFFAIEVLIGNAGNLLEAGEKFKIRVLGTYDDTTNNNYGDRLDIGTNVDVDLKILTKEGGEKKMSFTTPHVMDKDFFSLP